ncbi:MAG: Mov34/MPN/PAD-1 family protein [Myxococcales bacterium]|nr:MAG: Mov34/MPN/PAD-1 family protein [Myxococcales bacterium]
MSGEAAWIKGNLRIDKKVLDEIEAHALECYPSESCGFLVGPVDEPLLIDASVREENEADKYHKLDPVTFPRTSKMYFKINELRATRAFEQGEKSGRPIKAIYHSHCDAGAYFSEEDAATFASDNQLMWPCAFVVVSVQAGKIADRKLWVHQEGSNDFVESSLKVQ